MCLAPSQINYSYGSISNRFEKKPTEHAGVLIGKTLDDILSGKISIYAIDTIKVENPNGEYISADISKNLTIGVNAL